MDAMVTTRSVDLRGGRVLHVSRFRDPATARDRVTLVKGWTDSSPLPSSPDGQAVELAGKHLPALVDALRELGDVE